VRELDLVSSVLSACAEATQTQGLCAKLAAALGSEFGVRAAMLYELKSSGRLELREYFGFDHDVVTAFESPSLFEQLPIGTSILKASPVFVTRQQVMEKIDKARGLPLPFDGFLHLGCFSRGVATGGVALAITEVSGQLRVPSGMVLDAITTVGAARLRKLSFEAQRRQAA
jgi:hypothetical protein